MSVTLLIVILTGIISYQAFQNPAIFAKLKHYPIAESRNKEYYRFLTSGFVHGSWMHLIINMYVLYTFGERVEQDFQSLFGPSGRLIYLLLYITAIIIADVPSFLKHKNNPAYAAIGASGAVSGIVFVFIIFYPWSKLTIFPLVFLSFPAILGGVAYLVYSSWASKNARDNIDHSAHFYGAVYGMIFLFALKPSLIDYFINQLVQGWPF